MRFAGTGVKRAAHTDVIVDVEQTVRIDLTLQLGEKEYLEALRLRPDLPGLHLELGQVYANSAHWPKAEAEFRAEANLQPGNAEAAYRLGAALLQQGNARDALVELERSNQLKPEMPETLYSLGEAASLAGESSVAEESWRKVIELEKNTSLAAQAYFGLASLHRKQGKLSQPSKKCRNSKNFKAPSAHRVQSSRLPGRAIV